MPFINSIVRLEKGFGTLNIDEQNISVQETGMTRKKGKHMLVAEIKKAISGYRILRGTIQIKDITELSKQSDTFHSAILISHPNGNFIINCPKSKPLITFGSEFHKLDEIYQVLEENWKKARGTQTGASQATSPQAGTPPPPCPQCSRATRFIQQYNRFYCDQCQRYV